MPFRSIDHHPDMKYRNEPALLTRILNFLGLMTIKRARHIAEELVALRERSIVEYVRQDFNKPPKYGYELQIRNWANEQFSEAHNSLFFGEKTTILYEEEYSELLQDVGKLDAFLARHDSN